MNSLSQYIIEKFKISKNIKSSNDGEVILSAFRNCALKSKFPKQFFIYFQKWINESDSDSFEIFIRNYQYLELDFESKLNNSKLHDMKRKTFNSEFEECFPNYDSSNNTYTKYSHPNDESTVLINDDRSAFYFNFYISDKDISQNNPWLEILIIKK